MSDIVLNPDGSTKQKVYVHYGSKKFNKNRFDKIVNACWVKPVGGLWASAVDAKYGGKFYSFWYLGGKCEICGKLQKRHWYIQPDDIPNDIKKLPIVIQDTTGVTEKL